MKNLLIVLALTILTTGCRSTSTSNRSHCGGAPAAACPPGTAPVPLPPPPPNFRS